MTDEDLRERGIEYLLSQREKDKQPFELCARELAPVLGISQSSVYDRMAPLVKDEVWGTRYAYDPETHKRIRVWWLIE